MPTPADAPFAAWDWLVLGLYLAVVLVIGVLAGRRRAGGEDFFLAGRGMPLWAVAVSLLATMQSAATFVGGPQQAFDGDLTYLSSNIGPLLAAIVVAIFFIPVFYRAGVTSIYELIGQRFGTSAQRGASGMFLFGRLLASGARLYIVALPFSLIVFGDIRPPSMVLSIVLIAATATVYTGVGGIRAVIWTDVLQAVVYIGTVTIALVLLLEKFPVGVADVIRAVSASDAAEKLTVFDFRLSSPADLARPYTIWATIFGLTLFMIAAFGADQDLSQRLLTCRTRRAGSWSVIVANLLAWPVVLLFLGIGLLLFVYYRRPELVGLAGAGYAIDDSRKVFLDFILHEMPVGLRGLMLAGLFAAAMSSMDSALNAMASATVADFYRPWRRRTGSPDRELRAGRLAVIGWGVLLALFACLCVGWHASSGQTLIDFALGVMVFAYSGLLAVFAAALFTRRGSGPSAIAGLATGFACVLLMQPAFWTRWTAPLGIDFTLAFSWRMLVATALSFGVVCLGRSDSATPRLRD